VRGLRPCFLRGATARKTNPGTWVVAEQLLLQADRSLYPDEVTVSVSDEEETTRRLEGSVVVED
jgi:hypothetical protein